MFFWYVGGTVFAIWNVFQTNGLDVRLLALGGLAPVIVDAPFGAMRYGHTLLVPVALLALVMLATVGRGRRLARRRLLSLPIGWLAGLALSGAFTHAHVFWWPAFGTGFGNVALLPPVLWIVVFELVGLAALRWCWVRFGLRDPRRRTMLMRQGRVMAS
ncbi:MAG TPA: hypothetical protein VGI86_12880 [Acidimicrobiia bacterium]|jgi:hypothetical protein